MKEFIALQDRKFLIWKNKKDRFVTDYTVDITDRKKPYLVDPATLKSTGEPLPEETWKIPADQLMENVRVMPLFAGDKSNSRRITYLSHRLMYSLDDEDIKKKIKKVAPPKKGFTPSNVYLDKKKNE